MSISKLYACIKRKKVNTSQAREAIYLLLTEEENCISVSEMMHKLDKNYHKKVSLNTIYRHLTLFVDCGLVVVIQDDYKKAYYSVTRDKALVFTLCSKCNDVSVLKETHGMENVLLDLKSSEFISIHKKCITCR